VFDVARFPMLTLCFTVFNRLPNGSYFSCCRCDGRYPLEDGYASAADVTLIDKQPICPCWIDCLDCAWLLNHPWCQRRRDTETLYETSLSWVDWTALFIVEECPRVNVNELHSLALCFIGIVCPYHHLTLCFDCNEEVYSFDSSSLEPCSTKADVLKVFVNVCWRIWKS
jgi:hypothetical protein